ncbi:guanylate kinase [Francisella noatunensis]|uniref:Guanylate kinase n=1 Tax=Francisella noatunensis TaxID=657445 RepID=A0A9Q2KYI1_9GAMM|nr:guanylate kinase [Francisella noatunensis]MBK2028267.1 guanylate kinase [Francisella noatunensis]MBK2033233.1 guanylate kinase [Francisella noatunensis]MBK2049202.1 guanylate kinase [Francisella noatunensis]MBK2049905.1 guanylate kinase [Francisella noatunensis]MBK2051277.1 guanylate kinase [Francisella noatunensis]
MSNYIFIVSAPSGAGKSSLLKAFLETEIGKENFAVATSHTTRYPRIGETNGKEYHFVSIIEFEKMLDANGFIEYAKVFKNYYGTSKSEIDKLLAQGKNIILEIDWQGAQQTRSIYENKAKSIFILPASMDGLRKRLETRNTDSKEVIDYRMSQAESEISHADEYDYQLINDDFSQSLEQLCKYFEENIQS